MNEWSSLEIAKLIVSALVPVVGVIVAFSIAHYTKTLEGRRWRNEKLLEFRIEFFTEVGPKVNLLFTFCTLKNDWTKYSVQDIIDLKRFLDRKFHTFHMLLGLDVRQRYIEFAKNVFVTHQGLAKDPILRRYWRQYAGNTVGWTEADRAKFDTEVNETNEKAIRLKITRSYERLLAALGDAIELPRGHGLVQEHSITLVEAKTPPPVQSDKGTP